MTKVIQQTDLQCYKPVRFFHIANNNSKLFLHKQEQNLLKMCFDTPYEKLDFFQKLNIRNGITYPIDIYQSNMEGFESAYTMNYYSGALVLNHSFLNHLSLLHKRKIIDSYFKTLKQLHQYLVLGDIHMHNLLVHNGKALFCDWDSYRFLDEDKWISSPYYINHDGLEQNQLTDVIKLILSSLSFYFQEDLESLLKMQNYYSFIDIFQVIMNLIPKLTPDLELVIQEFLNDHETSQFSSDSFLSHLPKHINSNVSIIRKLTLENIP